MCGGKKPGFLDVAFVRRAAEVTDPLCIIEAAATFRCLSARMRYRGIYKVSDYI